MACEFIRDANGDLVKIRCGRGAPRCYFCGKESTKLCDYPLAHGTCDAQICRACATTVGMREGDSLDLCPNHKQHAESMRQQR